MAAPWGSRFNRHSSSVAHVPELMMGSSEGAAVSELARRILRSRGVKISHNGLLSEEIELLSNELSDNAPKIIFGIESIVRVSEDIYFEMQDSKDGLISISPPESLEIVWIKKTESVWNNLKQKIIELGRAGYPGCVGCAGPAANEPWNETDSRNQIL